MFLKLTLAGRESKSFAVNTDQIISIEEHNFGSRITTTATKREGGSKTHYVSLAPDKICELLGGDYTDGTSA